jgi:hypothetical protein
MPADRLTGIHPQPRLWGMGVGKNSRSRLKHRIILGFQVMLCFHFSPNQIEGQQ